ncbi:MAG: C39 family peptidase [Deltaproteobacteria bacterium]|nr:C39 family peptidase [Deltaproteobacteria bacterium]MBI3293385.1 C39 family peptidase [Deltaproteobacteria bacterium]
MSQRELDWLNLLILLVLVGSSPVVAWEKKAESQRTAQALVSIQAGQIPAGSALTHKEIDEIIAQGRLFDVPYYRQSGDTCGLYALKMVVAYYHQNDPYNADPPAEMGGKGESRESIHDLARRKRQLWSDKGSTFPWHLKNLAQDLGYNSWQTYSVLGGSIAELKKDVMERRVPMIVAVGNVNGSSGKPEAGELVGGHWVIVEGFTTYKAVDYMIIKHGWSGGSVVWKVSDFQKAWRYGSAVGVWPAKR